MQAVIQRQLEMGTLMLWQGKVEVLNANNLDENQAALLTFFRLAVNSLLSNRV